MNVVIIHMFYYTGYIHGARVGGRPRKKWIDSSKEDCSFCYKWCPIIIAGALHQKVSCMVLQVK